MAPNEHFDDDSQIIEWLEDFFTNQTYQQENLIGILQRMQEHFGYLPKRGMVLLAEKLQIPPANIFGVATFYNQFRFTPPGKHAVKVCMGTACAIKQGQLIIDQWERRLDIAVGDVTEDREYSLDRVDCVGCCTLAPVTIINDEVIGEMSTSKVDGIILRYQIEKDKAEREQDK